jgi:phospholipid-translocating ATPase
MAGYYRQFIPGFATLAAPLTDLTKSREPFRWGSEQQEAFDALKTALTQSPILVHPDVSKPYILYTDASNKAVGAILVQKDNEGVERVISYLSHKLSGAQLNWATIEKEAYAIIYALKKFHADLGGAKFEIHTDHKPLRSLFQSEIRSSKISRWSQQIQEFQAPILYHPGKLNIHVDMLSRIAAIEPSTPTPVVVPADIPDVWVTDRIDLHDLARRQKE